MPEIIETKDKKHWLECRSKDITSTEASALFGLSPYMTQFELWHQKKDQVIIELDENERMTWGNRLESVIAKGIGEDNNWDVSPLKVYMRDTYLRMGSSFDFEIPEMKALLEIKNVDAMQFKEKWIVEDGELEAPPHIEIQVQHQLAVSDKDKAYIGALIGGNNVRLMERGRNEVMIKKIRAKVEIFWASIESNEEPEPNFMRDASFLTQLYSEAKAGKVLESHDDHIRTLAFKYNEYQKAEKMWGEYKKAAKAELLTLIGDNSKVVGDGFSISAGEREPKMIEAYERKGYRDFRVYKKKEKADAKET